MIQLHKFIDFLLFFLSRLKDVLSVVIDTLPCYLLFLAIYCGVGFNWSIFFTKIYIIL